MASITTPATITNLRYILRSHVINDTTKSVISTALQKAGVNKDGKVPGWPGYTFDNYHASPFKRNSMFEALLGKRSLPTRPQNCDEEH